MSVKREMSDESGFAKMAHPLISIGHAGVEPVKLLMRVSRW